MIIVEDGAELRIVTQGDHACFASELLTLWRTHGLPEHPRRAELLFSVREHDNGWREADAAPLVDVARGRPFDFATYPEEARLEIWRRGMTRYAADRPYTCLLIAEHAETLHQPPSDGWRRLLAAFDEQRQAWLEETALQPRAVRADYRFLRLADTLSLTACGRWRDRFECLGVRGHLAADCLFIEPFPLAGATTFRIPCRRIPRRRYRTDSEAGSALAMATWTRFELRVLPA